MKGYIVRLWKEPTEARFVIHRVLFRIYADNIHYIQDLNIQGVDEHNQYNGDLTSYQISQIADYLVSRYALYKISSPQDLYERLVGPRGLTLTKESLRFESKNGTSLKPSFFYLEDYLLPKYELVSFEEAGLQPPVAFYTKFPGSPNVSTYDNMKVVRDASTKKNLCIVKAKFFRQQEFPRRAKEEAYVGFTTKYEYFEGHLKLRYSGLPLFMFVDMAADYVPPAHAIIRMINYCWIPIFQLQDLVHYLETGKIYES